MSNKKIALIAGSVCALIVVVAVVLSVYFYFATVSSNSHLSFTNIVPSNYHSVGPTNPNTERELSVLLVNPFQSEVDALLADAVSGSLLARNYVNASTNLFEASLEHIKIFQSFVSSLGSVLSSSDQQTRTISFQLSVHTINFVFGIVLEEFEENNDTTNTTYTCFNGTLNVPKPIQQIVLSVYGLCDIPLFQHNNLELTQSYYTGTQLASFYNFPAAYIGSGQCVAIVELGGGYLESDLSLCWQNAGITTPPHVTWVSVDGATNTFGSSSADTEVALDIQVVGTMAPGASIIVYFAPNSLTGFIDVVKTIVTDTRCGGNPASIVSISWIYRAEMDFVIAGLEPWFQQAVVKGISIFVASGDWGAEDGVGYPASSSYVTAVGGTSITVNSQNQISSEVVWNNANGATGGGISAKFSVPVWQASAGISNNRRSLTGRGVPDVSAVADPHTGYLVYLGSNINSVGGTSASAPLWASLVARLNQAYFPQKVGLLTSVIYGLSSKAGFNDITSGNNYYESGLSYSATAGWDCCTGWGSPNGNTLMASLTPVQLAYNYYTGVDFFWYQMGYVSADLCKTWIYGQYYNVNTCTYDATTKTNNIITNVTGSMLKFYAFAASDTKCSKGVIGSGSFSTPSDDSCSQVVLGPSIGSWTATIYLHNPNPVQPPQ